MDFFYAACLLGIHHLTLWQRVDEPGRDRSHGRRQVYPAGAGTRPFLSDKFDITAHKNYKYLADADKKNEFDVERYMKRRPAVVKPEEPFEMYELEIEPDSDNEKN